MLVLDVMKDVITWAFTGRLYGVCQEALVKGFKSLPSFCVGPPPRVRHILFEGLVFASCCMKDTAIGKVLSPVLLLLVSCLSSSFKAS